MRIGILSLQGAVSPHREHFSRLGIETTEVRQARDLAGITGLVLPGGESTAMIHLLHKNALWTELQTFVSERPSWGICAGAILLASTVTHPAQQSLGTIHIHVERNGYGRQLDSFIDDLEPSAIGKERGFDSIKGVFIRAPRIREVGSNCATLLTWHSEPVLVQEGRSLVSTFHPELTEDLSIHRFFVNLCQTTT